MLCLTLNIQNHAQILTEFMTSYSVKEGREQKPVCNSENGAVLAADQKGLPSGTWKGTVFSRLKPQHRMIPDWNLALSLSLNQHVDGYVWAYSKHKGNKK